MLRLVFTLGWLPALLCASVLRAGTGLPAVLSGAGSRGAAVSAGLAVTLAILTAGYLAALRRPPEARELLTAAAGSLLAALAMPLLFSADVYAYAYYGDLALHGQNPYGHGVAPVGDPLAAAAVSAWDGHVPPRCVYGPVAVGLAALVDAAGAAGGASLQIELQRLAAAAAYAVYAAFILTLVPQPRARAAFLLNPVVLWSVAEGHNDAAMTALAAAGVAAARTRPLWFAAAALVKATALVMWTKLERPRDRLAAAAVVAAGYVPLALAAGGAFRDPPGAPAPWESPLGLAAAFAGRAPAVVAGLAGLAAATLAVRPLRAGDRAPALALAAWFALPNAYPWYALWIVPLAARGRSSRWSRALIAAALFAPARAVTDAVFGATQRLDAAPSLHLGMIALEYLPPLAVVCAARLKPRIAVLVAVAAFVMCLPAPVGAESSAPSPMPAAAPATPPAGPSAGSPAPLPPVPSALPQPAPPALPQPVPSALPLPSPSGSPLPLPSGSPQPLPAASPQPVPSGVPQPSPSASPGLLAPPSAELSPAPSNPASSAAGAPAPGATAPGTAIPPAIAPPAVATPNPFGYIINPPPIPTTTPDGPHILQVDVNDRRIRAGGPLLVRVFTSANVVGVEARALGRFIAIPQSSPGLFALAYTMPAGIPFWLLNRNYQIVIAAATADGRQTSVSFPMLLVR